MSGGYFDYKQYPIEDIACRIDDIVTRNDDLTLDEYGSPRGCGYTVETIEKFRLAAKMLRAAATMAQRIDWLLSGDDGEDGFHRRWDEELKDSPVGIHPGDHLGPTG